MGGQVGLWKEFKQGEMEMEGRGRQRQLAGGEVAGGTLPAATKRQQKGHLVNMESGRRREWMKGKRKEKGKAGRRLASGGAACSES